MTTTENYAKWARYFYKYSSSDRSIDLCVLRDSCRQLFCAFGNFYMSGTQDAEEPKSLDQHCSEKIEADYS